MPLKKVFTDEEIGRRFSALPDAIAEAFESSETARSIFEIGRMNGLTIDKVGYIAREVGYLMLGLVPTREFIPDLTEIVGNKEKAKVIAAEINRRILLPIRESLKKLYDYEWSETLAIGAEKAATPPPSAPKIVPPPPPKPPPAPARPRPMPVPPPPQKPPPAPVGPKKPEPLIIRPLPPMAGISDQGIGDAERELGIVEAKPPAQISRGETWAGKPPTTPIAPKTPVGPPPSTPKLQVAPPPPPELPIQMVKPKPATPPPAQPLEKPDEKKAPIIRPLGMMPNEEVLEVRGQVQDVKETKPMPPPLKPISPPPIPPRPVPPPPPQPIKSPHIITKEMMEREMERMRKRDQVGEDDKSDKIVQVSEAPKLPAQKIPKPPAPERYTVDPYKEPVE